MWVDGQSFWYYLVTYVFFEARVRDGDHPVRNAGRGDVARLQGQGEVRRRAHPLRPDRAILAARGCPAHHRAPRRQEIGRDVLVPRRDLLGVLHARGAGGLSIHLGAAARARSRASPTSGPRSRRCASLAQLFGDCGRRCASARSACISACTSAATSARTSSTPCSPTSSCSRCCGTVVDGVQSTWAGWRSRSCSRWSLRSALCLRFHPAPSYRIAVVLFAVGVDRLRCAVRDPACTELWWYLRWWSWSPASAAARSTTFRGASTTTWRTSTKSSPAGAAKARSPAS